MKQIIIILIILFSSICIAQPVIDFTSGSSCLECHFNLETTLNCSCNDTGISSLSAGTGLTGGTITDSGTIAVNTSYFNDNYYNQCSDVSDCQTNSSDYWDNLDDPSDISAGDITDDGTYWTSCTDSNTCEYLSKNSSLYINQSNWYTDRFLYYDIDNLNLTINLTALLSYYETYFIDEGGDSTTGQYTFNGHIKINDTDGGSGIAVYSMLDGVGSNAGVFHDASLGTPKNYVQMPIGGNSYRGTLSVVRNLPASNTGLAVARISQLNSNDNQAALSITQSGTGNYISSGEFIIDYKNNTEIGENLTIGGVLSKGSGSFRIDNPEDPLNTVMYHQFHEGAEAILTYRGTDISYDNGHGWNYTVSKKDNKYIIRLPSWFDDLTYNNNINEYTGLLSARDNFCGDNYFNFENISNNIFTIITEKPCSFSWMIQAVRHDYFYDNMPMDVIVEKPAVSNYIEDKNIIIKDDGVYESIEYKRQYAKGNLIHARHDINETEIPDNILRKIK